MLTHIKFVSVPTRDQDRALAFWTEKVGLSVVTDQPFDGKQRWIELRFPNRVGLAAGLDRRQNLGVDQPAQGLHARASGRTGRRGSRRQAQLLCCLASHSRPSSRTPPCRASKKPVKLVRPEPIQLWPRFSRL